jgi:uncharacterized iron-regulated membrane protein
MQPFVDSKTIKVVLTWSMFALMAVVVAWTGWPASQPARDNASLPHDPRVCRICAARKAKDPQVEEMHRRAAVGVETSAPPWKHEPRP